MDGNRIKDSEIKSDRKFYGVPVIIISTLWESGTNIYEADSPEEALKMYEAGETAIDVDYTGWQDQEFKYDELDTDGETELIENERADIQWILQREAEREENEREEANREQGH
jgi:hypothetical protein